MKLNLQAMKWTREPKSYNIFSDKVEIITDPYTDLWQRTYYHFRNDNAPVHIGSIVVKDIPSIVLAVGNPCTVLREINEHDKDKYSV